LHHHLVVRIHLWILQDFLHVLLFGLATLLEHPERRFEDLLQIRWCKERPSLLDVIKVPQDHVHDRSVRPMFVVMR